MLAYGVSADDLFAAFVGSDIVIDLTGQTSDHGEIVDRLTSLVAGWALKGPLAFGVDTEHKKTTIIDNGDAPISVSFLSDISKVIASLAVAPFDKLPSRVSIQSDSTTSKEVIDIYESVLGEKLSTVGAERKDLDFSANNDNEFVNPGLFEWTNFKTLAEKVWQN